MTRSTPIAPDASRVRLSDLGQRGTQPIAFAPDAETRARIAARLDLIGLRKARLEGRLVPTGRRDWDLEARLGATVVQPCIATLAPVTTRIEETVLRRYRAEVPRLEDLPATETEMPEDDTLEPLPETVDLAALFEEALALNLPAFPRARDATLDQTDFAAPGETPLTYADLKPFAGLADLRRALGPADTEGGSGGAGTDGGGTGDDGAEDESR